MLAGSPQLWAYATQGWQHWLPIAPAAHYFGGGVETDVDGRTGMPGLYAVGEGACLGPLTLVAKGETLPAGTRWEGSPAAPVCGGAHA